MRDMTNDKRYTGITSAYYPTNSLISLIDTLVRVMHAVRSVIVAQIQ
jgi:hypothetical protein